MTTQNLDNTKLNSDLSRKWDRMSGSLDSEDNKGLPESAQYQIDTILLLDPNPKSIIDVGSGAGGLLKEALDKGIEKGTGVDFSPKNISNSQKRLATFGDRIDLKLGNFVELDLVKHDAVSMHRVLCCYPDSLNMLDKAIHLDPKVITFTLMRPRFFLKIARLVSRIVNKIVSIPIIYLHNLDKLDEFMIANDYVKHNETNFGLIWVTKTYSLAKSD